MSNERKRSWERDEFDDEDEILGTKKVFNHFYQKRILFK